MKKILCLILAVSICFLLAACGNTGDGGTQGVVSTGKSVDEVINEEIGKAQTVSQPVTALPSSTVPQNRPTRQHNPEGEVDIDLTKLSSTMVYSEVYNMVSTPEKYLGKTVRMSGGFTFQEGETRNYYACIISDATACCAQGIEFVLKDSRKFPDEYPGQGEDIMVKGTFDTYYEGNVRYCQLSNAVFE